ncbi:MAG TPA: PIN domain-containing protein [Thermoanaerobaculia bacterium]|nr:PIN domain-containing protein [Thermoanaerobaculia bacterium]
MKLDDYIEAGDTITTCPMVAHEVLRGARNQFVYDGLKLMLGSVVMFDETVPFTRFEEAARLYRRCRESGVTPSTPDCLIAATAIAHRAELFHLDADYAHIARVVPELLLFTRS